MVHFHFGPTRLDKVTRGPDTDRQGHLATSLSRLATYPATSCVGARPFTTRDTYTLTSHCVMRQRMVDGNKLARRLLEGLPSPMLARSSTAPLRRSIWLLLPLHLPLTVTHPETRGSVRWARSL